MELLSVKAKEVDPTDYFFRSEDYFTVLMSMKSVMDKMVSDRHLNHIVIGSKRKCIR